MKRLISCEYNFDNCFVELKFTDGSMIAIDTIAVENEVARLMPILRLRIWSLRPRALALDLVILAILWRTVKSTEKC